MPRVAEPDERWTEAPSWWEAETPPHEWFHTPVADVLPPIDFDALLVDLELELQAAAAAEMAGDEFLMDVLAGLEPLPPRAWRSVARPKQLPPLGEWLYWLLMAGRGFGKSLVGSNSLVEMALAEPGDYAAVGPTFADARKIMTEGETGLLVALGDDLRLYHRGDFILYLTNGSRIILASADAPDRLRGLNLRGAWLDEFASFSNARSLWDLVLLPALRKGRLPRVVITTTPRRGAEVIKELIARADKGDPRVVVTRGRTEENRENLSEAWWQAMHDRYAGTTAGRQELDGELLEEVEGALWSGALIEATRLRVDQVPRLWRIVIGVDPATSSHAASDETGIVVVGIGPPPEGWQPPNGLPISKDVPHLYVLSDVSLRAIPTHWGRLVLIESDEWAADRVVGERNNGGDMVMTTMTQVADAEGLPTPAIELVWASVGKHARAEPVSGVFEQGRGHIVGAWPLLEGELTSWVKAETKESPNRLDGMVWAAVELMPELGIKSGTKVALITDAGRPKSAEKPDGFLGLD